MNRNNLPLELVDPLSYGYLDTAQKQIIFDHDGLDLVLMENANETFRQFMMDGNNMHIERLLEKIRCENENSMFLRSDTLDIKFVDGVWNIDDSKQNKKTLKKYIEDAVRKLKKSKINKQSIIYTIFGLNLGEGGHYGALVCDLKQSCVRIFDSMSGTYSNDKYLMTSGTQECFMELSKRIFNSRDMLKVIHDKTKKIYKFHCKQVNIAYILQPTGGFEEFISPDLEGIEDEVLKKNINIQHTDSQNHFCYIWSLLFVQIYLRGKLKLFNSFIQIMKEKELIPLTVIKQYILGLMNVMNQGDLDHVLFFYKHFPRIWSNKDDQHSIDFSVYGINFKSARNMSGCLDYVMKLNVNIKTLRSVSCQSLKDEINEFICDYTDCETDEDM